MKKMSIIVLITAVIICCICCYKDKNVINVSFATEAYVLNDGEKRVVDANDLGELKSLLEGKLYVDNPSCGFSNNISITFFNEKEEITICPALDGCNTMLVKEVNKYFKISEGERESLDNVLELYGIEFPAV